jgi:hypothetical protein
VGEQEHCWETEQRVRYVAVSAARLDLTRGIEWHGREFCENANQPITQHGEFSTTRMP